MKGTRNLTVLIIVGLILILGMWSCGGYNGLVKQDETVKNKWNDVQSSYQRRGDLIPNLVATVKGAAELLIQTGHHPEQEIDKVTTPKGCTIAGLNEMEHQGFSSSLIKGIIASYKKIAKD